MLKLKQMLMYFLIRMYSSKEGNLSSKKIIPKTLYLSHIQQVQKFQTEQKR